MNDRILAWEGCSNVRDLGGLRTCAGGLTRRGAVVRSDTTARLTPDGQQALIDYGIRTVNEDLDRLRERLVMTSML